MLKLNKKGFAISSIMYLILVLALILISLTITLIISRKIIIDKQKKDVLNLMESNLSLSKITYVDIPFNNWTKTNATLDNEGILTLGSPGTYGEVNSDYIDVNGGRFYFVFDGFAENESSKFSPNGGIYWNIRYYDLNKAEKTALNNHLGDGYARSVELNKWNNNLSWLYYNTDQGFGRHEKNIKYIIVYFASGISNRFISGDYSIPPVKIRNLKLYGTQIPNSFYFINCKLKNNKEIKKIRYSKGIKNKDYFELHGIEVNNKSDNQIRVTENGTYTVYVVDTEGNDYISTVSITDVVENNLSLSKETSKELPFDSSWLLSDSEIDGNGIANIGDIGVAGFIESDYIDVNKGFYFFTLDAYASNPSSTYNPYGGVVYRTEYFNENKIKSLSNEGLGINGWGIPLSLGSWNNNLDWYQINGYDLTRRNGPNVKYLKIRFFCSKDGSYSVCPVNVKNLKIHGTNIPNNYYNININLKNSESIQLIKYEKGVKPAYYFESNGIVSNDNPIRVTENGIYTVYVLDTNNNKYISTIEITDIIN